MTSSPTIHDVIVIGSGPAGYTAAVYAARAQLKPLVFEGSQFGGALMTTTEVENYPGFKDGIMGPELMDQMREQALRFGADLRMEDVDAVDLTGPVKTVTVGDETHHARSVILAMGAAARHLGVPGEDTLLGMGVSTCATCDGFFFRDQDIAVVGGGDSAMEEATFLTRFARSVTLIHRRDEFRASRIMLERAQANEKITILTNTAVTAIEGDPKVSGIRLRNTVTGEESDLAVTGAIDRRRSPTKAKASPTKKPSPVRKVESQIASGKGPDTIAGSNTYKALCAVCKKWGLPTGTIAQKADMATALIVEQWKKMTSAA